MKKKLNKIKIERKKYYCILIGLILIGIIIAVMAINMNVKSTKFITTNRYYYLDRLDYYVYLRPNTLFNNTTVLKDSKIFLNITNGVNIIYTFRVNSINRTTVNGTYEILATLQTKEWNKTIVIVPPHKYKNKYTISFPMNLYRFKELYNRINRELGFKAMNPKVEITIKTTVKSKDLYDIYTHSLWFPLSSKVFSIHTVNSLEKVKSLKKLVNVVDTNKCKIRLLLGVSSFIPIIAAVVFYLITVPVTIKRDVITEIYRKNKDFIIIGKPKFSENMNIIELGEISELLKASEILNKPIIKTNDCFCILDENTIYCYNFKNKK